MFGNLERTPVWPVDADPNCKRVRPPELKSPLPNPHKGCATHQRFAGDAVSPWGATERAGPRAGGQQTDAPAPPPELTYKQHYLPSTRAYCRGYWTDFQPESDRFDWSVMEHALATARARGQTLQVRLMPHGSVEGTELPQWYRDRCPTVAGRAKDTPYTAAVYDGPEYLEHWGHVVREFAARYDGHPDLESVDAAFVGPWGEGAGECAREGMERMMAVYAAAHTRTPVMAMLKHYIAARPYGFGWRFDSFGDLGYFRGADLPGYVRWTHMHDWYPRMICRNEAHDAWQRGPVALETSAVPMMWYHNGWDLDFITQQGLKYHATSFMPKSVELPSAWRDRLTAFCDAMGYRFVLRQLRYPAVVRGAEPLSFACWIENTGAAPIYHQYDLALRLTQGTNTHLHREKADTRAWQPGDAWLEGSVSIPQGFEAGRIQLHTLLLHPQDQARRVRFANQGLTADGWLDVGEIELA